MPIKILKKSDIKRFWAKVDKSGDCWIWTAYKDKDGYGTFKVDGKMVRAHRYSYQIHFGEIPEGMSALHICDKPPCVNPEHLFLGTQQNNIEDMVEKGRHSFGVAHGMAKLDEEIVRCVRRYHPIFTQKQLAEFFNVSPVSIHRIIVFKNWKTVQHGGD